MDVAVLKKDWHTIDNYVYCQSFGSKWLNGFKSAVLKVPSVTVKKEHNYLINPNHPDFKLMTFAGNEDFDFDKRF